MLFRYGVKNKLHFALPSAGIYFGRGIPFSSSMIPKSVIGDFDVNIFAIHTQWDYEELKKVMPKETIFIASVRDPIAVFESLFTYANFEQETGFSFEEYVKYTPPNSQRVLGYLGFNQMTFDFGLPESELENVTAVMDLIEKADKYFDLVVSVEKFDESLILLRHILCWSLEDILTIKINSRLDSVKTELSEDVRESLRDRLSSDYLLYNHFEKKLEKLITDFGVAKMAQQLVELENAVQEVTKECGFTEQNKLHSSTDFYKPFSDQVKNLQGHGQKEKCRQFMLPENNFIDEIRDKQRLRVSRKFGYFGTLTDWLPKGAVPLDKVPIETLNSILHKNKTYQ